MAGNTNGSTETQTVMSGRYVKYAFLSTYLNPSFLQCISEENYLVAHYDLRQPHMPAYGVSGNTLTVHESFCHLSIGMLLFSIPGQ
jgi:hypothetical protein